MSKQRIMFVKLLFVEYRMLEQLADSACTLS